MKITSYIIFVLVLSSIGLQAQSTETKIYSTNPLHAIKASDTLIGNWIEIKRTETLRYQPTTTISIPTLDTMKIIFWNDSVAIYFYDDEHDTIMKTNYVAINETKIFIFLELHNILYEIKYAHGMLVLSQMLVPDVDYNNNLLPPEREVLNYFIRESQYKYFSKQELDKLNWNYNYYENK